MRLKCELAPNEQGPPQPTSDIVGPTSRTGMFHLRIFGAVGPKELRNIIKQLELTAEFVGADDADLQKSKTT